MLTKTINVTVLLGLLLIFSTTAGAQYGPRPDEEYINHRFYFSIVYNPHDVLCENSDSVTGDGITLCVPYGQINVYGSPGNDFEPSTWLNEMGITEEEMNENSADRFFVNQVNGCREVPADGYFGAYYDCGGNFYQAAIPREGPRGFYTVYHVNYLFYKKPQSLELFKQILRTFQPTPVE